MLKNSTCSFLITLTFIMVIAAGCAPVISKSIREQVNPNITIQEVLSNPERYKGEIIIVSGDIIDATITREGTLLKVMQRPTGAWGKPKNVDETAGRFLATADFYLDPYIYKKGRKVTVGGEVQGVRELPEGEIRYRYPVIHVKEIYLWPVERRYYYPYYYPYRPYYYYDDYWWWRRGFWYY
ncbi:MAG: hypothetical protein E3K32_13500 [wastewater metagenome]|nr:hypothetical protein [Candidatus Loosdrechtia aerotolerans]